MKSEIEANKLSPRADRKNCGYGKMILDSWPLPDPYAIGNILCAVETAYLEL
jgi:hypothetical protein